MRWCGTDWQASSTVSAPARRAISATSATGAMLPVTFDTCANATTRVRGPTAAARSSIDHSPRSSTGTQRSVAPVRAASRCHGMRFAWCSASVTSTSSPGRSANRSPPSPSDASDIPSATTFSASVAFSVHTISFGAAPTKAATSRGRPRRPSSPSPVAMLEPRWTAA